MALLSKAAFLAAGNLKRETVNVPELGGEVIVQELTAGERDQYEMMLYERGKKEDAPKDYLRAALVVASVVDESGAKIFTAADVPAISKQSAAAIDRIVDVARRLSAMDGADQEKQLKN